LEANAFVASSPHPQLSLSQTEAHLACLGVSEADGTLRLDKDPTVEELRQEVRSSCPADKFDYLRKWADKHDTNGLDPVFGHMDDHGAAYEMVNRQTCMQMIHAAEEAVGTKYEYVVLSRFDSKWLAPHPPLSFLKGDVGVPDNSDYGGVNDRYAVMPRRSLDVYCGMWSALKTCSLPVPDPVPRGFNGNCEALLAGWLTKNRLQVSRMPVPAALICVPPEFVTKGTWVKKCKDGFKYPREIKRAAQIQKALALVGNDWSKAYQTLQTTSGAKLTDLREHQTYWSGHMVHLGASDGRMCAFRPNGKLSVGHCGGSCWK
jgi:hypothetical protein